MRFKIVTLFAVVGLLAACASGPEEGGSAGGAGGTGASGSGASSGAVSGSGTLPGPMAGSPEELVSIGDSVFFDFDRYNLKANARATLEKQAAWLMKNPAVSILIEGHCDERGTREYNLALGERRANSAKDYLIALGVAPSRIRTISYGEERPFAVGSNETAWAQNRRARTRIRGAAVGS